MTLFLAGLLLAVMAAVEAVNFRRIRRVTFLTVAHAVIAVGYCLPPFLLCLSPALGWEPSRPPGISPFNPWGDRLYLLDLSYHAGLSDSAYSTVGMILLGAYAALLAGYLAGRRAAPGPLKTQLIQDRALLGWGVIIGSVAVAAIAVYSLQFDGLADMLNKGVHIRKGSIQVTWGFLQVLGQLGLPAFLILAAAAFRLRGRAGYAVAGLAAAVWCVALVRILHVGGRLELAAFLLIPVLAWIFVTKRKGAALAVLAGAGLAAVTVAVLPDTFARAPVDAAVAALGGVLGGLPDHLLYAAAYLGFPHIAAAHTLTVVPDVIGFRYFIDVPLGAAYMLPNFSGVETLPPMILSLHVKLLPWIPVDLFSFGYYSLGTVGVLVTFAAFGAMLAVMDGWLTVSTGWLGQALRAAWLFYLPFRVLYADPYAAAQSGFGLIAGTLVILALWLVTRRRARSASTHPDR